MAQAYAAERAHQQVCHRGEPQAQLVGAERRGRGTVGEEVGLAFRGFIAPLMLDGAINRNAFETYVAKVLVPELRPGDVVVMDNLSSHTGPRVRDLIEAAGASLRDLPPYSSDFNPIEMTFSKLEALLRKAAERTMSGLWQAIGRLIGLVSPDECANYFAAAGYDAYVPT